MYISICLKDFNKFKCRTFYDSYQQGNYAYIRPEGTNDDFTRIELCIYHKYFEWALDFVAVPSYDEDDSFLNIIRKLFHRQPTIHLYENNFLEFKGELRYLRKVQANVFYYIEIVKDKELLAQFYDTIEYTIKSLAELYKSRDLLDFDKEIEKASAVMQEIYNFIEPIERAANSAEKQTRLDKLKEIMPKHNAIMESNIRFLQEVNTACKLLKD